MTRTEELYDLLVEGVEETLKTCKPKTMKRELNNIFPKDNKAFVVLSKIIDEASDDRTS